MANLTVSSAVDNMLQGTTSADIRSKIGALSLGDLENLSVTFGDDVNFDSPVQFNDETTFDSNIIVNNTAQFEDDTTFNSQTEFLDDSTFDSQATFNSNTEFNDELRLTGDLVCEGPSEFSDVATFSSAISVQSSLTFSGSNGKFKAPSGTASGYSSPSAGNIIFDTSDSKLKVYTGTSWVALH